MSVASDQVSLDELLDRCARFSGFSLEKRMEWKEGIWRARSIPNKTTRQDYRAEAHGHSAREAMENLKAKLEKVNESTQP